MGSDVSIFRFKISKVIVGFPDRPISEIQQATAQPVLTKEGRVGLAIHPIRHKTTLFECNAHISPLNSWAAGKFLEKCLRRHSTSPLFLEIRGGRCEFLEDVCAVMNRKSDKYVARRLARVLSMTPGGVQSTLAEVADAMPPATEIEEIANGLVPGVEEELKREIRYAIEDGRISDPYEVDELRYFAGIPLYRSSVIA